MLCSCCGGPASWQAIWSPPAIRHVKNRLVKQQGQVVDMSGVSVSPTWFLTCVLQQQQLLGMRGAQQRFMAPSRLPRNNVSKQRGCFHHV